MRVAFWSKQPLAFNRAHVPLARRIAYQLGLGTSSGSSDNVTRQIDDDGPTGGTPACSEPSTG